MGRELSREKTAPPYLPRTIVLWSGVLVSASLGRKWGPTNYLQESCHELVQLRRMLFRRGVSGKCCASLLSRHFRGPFPHSFCETARTWVVIAHSQCRMGLDQPGCGISIVSGR